MSSGPENTFIRAVNKYVPADVYRMKNHNQYNGGIADVWYSGAKADLWIEYKFIEIPVRGDTMIDLVGGKNPPLSHLQQEWITARKAEGRNVWVIVGSKSGGVVFQDLSWKAKLNASAFRALLCSRNELGSIITRFCM